jgi:hypothetical protein
MPTGYTCYYAPRYQHHRRAGSWSTCLGELVEKKDALVAHNLALVLKEVHKLRDSHRGSKNTFLCDSSSGERWS